MKGDRELCMAAVTRNWQAIGHVSQELKKDPLIIVNAVHSMRRDRPAAKDYYDLWLKQYGVVDEGARWKALAK